MAMRDELDRETFSDTFAGADEPISPELVLVTPELRSLVVAEPAEAPEAPEAPAGAAHEPEPAPPAEPPKEPGLAARLVLYAAWQTFVGALFGLAAFVAFAVLAVGIAFLAR
jgi:hypothetical protein